MSEPEPPRLDYARPGVRRDPTAAERAGTFIVAVFLTPVTLAATIAGLGLLGSSVLQGLIVLAVAVLTGFVLSLSLRDERYRRSAITGGLTGIGVCALLAGACFVALTRS